MNIKTAISIVSILAIGTALLGLSPGQKMQVTKDQAIASCRKFLKLAGLPDPKQSVRIREIPAYTGFKDRWDIVYNGEYRFYVHQMDGVVTSFTNSRRIEEQFKRTQKRSTRRFATAAQVKPYVQALALKLGLRPQAKLEKLEFVSDGDPRRTDANRAGRIQVLYRTRPFGYEFYELSGNRMGFNIDPVDGALVRFAQTWDYKIESHAVRISKTKAIAAAEAVFRPYRKKHRSFHTAVDQPVAKVELKYVIPNGDFGAPYSDTGKRRLARLAYIVYFGVDHVFIDSATGKLLGGGISV